MVDIPHLFKIYRKKGVWMTLHILRSFENSEARQDLFFKSLKKGDHLNSFFRVKQDLLDYNLIAYKLDDDTEKVLYISENGLKFCSKLDELEKLLKKSYKKPKIQDSVVAQTLTH